MLLMRGKALVTAILALVVVSLPSVCHADVTISYFHRSNVTEVQWAQEMKARFEEQHPDITVELINAGTGGGPEFAEKLAMLIAGGSAPDVFFGSTDKLGYILKGWARDLTGLIARDKEELETDTFFPGLWSAFERNGRTYGLPLTVTPQVIFWNKDLVGESGLPPLPTDWDSTEWTWDDFVLTCKKMTVVRNDGTVKQVGVTQATEAHLPDVCWMFGGDWFPSEAYETGIAQRATMTRPENVRAFEALQELYASYAAAGPPKGISTWSGFVEGRAAMDWIGTWKMDNFMDAYRSGSLGFSWGLAPVPLVENRSNTRWTDPLYIFTETKNVEAAWEFVKFATSTEGQTAWAAATGKIPARRTAIGTFVQAVQEASTMSEEEILQGISGAVAHSRTSLEESMFGVKTVLASHRDQWFGPILSGEKSVNVGLKQIEETLNAMLPEINSDLQ